MKSSILLRVDHKCKPCQLVFNQQLVRISIMPLQNNLELVVEPKIQQEINCPRCEEVASARFEGFLEEPQADKHECEPCDKVHYSLPSIVPCDRKHEGDWPNPWNVPYTPIFNPGTTEAPYPWPQTWCGMDIGTTGGDITVGQEQREGVFIPKNYGQKETTEARHTLHGENPVPQADPGINF